MIRKLVAVAFLLACAIDASAQTNPPSQELVQRIAAETNRSARLIAMISEAAVPVPQMPPNATLKVAQQVATQGLASVLAHRPALERLQAEFAAMGPLPRSGISVIDETLALNEKTTGMVIEGNVALSADYEAYSRTILRGDRAAADQLGQKIGRGLVLSMEGAVVNFRTMKITVAHGEPIESAKFEVMALPLDGSLVLTKFRMGMLSKAEAATQLAATAQQIRDLLPLARSVLAKDPQNLSDPPPTASTLARMNRAQWKTLEGAEDFATFLDRASAKFKSGPIDAVRFDAIYGEMQHRIHDMRVEMEQGFAAFQQLTTRAAGTP